MEQRKTITKVMVTKVMVTKVMVTKVTVTKVMVTKVYHVTIATACKPCKYFLYCSFSKKLWCQKQCKTNTTWPSVKTLNGHSYWGIDKDNGWSLPGLSFYNHCCHDSRYILS